MSDCANNLIRQWREKSYDQKWFDLAPEMTKFTLNVLAAHFLMQTSMSTLKLFTVSLEHY